MSQDSSELNGLQRYITHLVKMVGQQITDLTKSIAVFTEVQKQFDAHTAKCEEFPHWVRHQASNSANDIIKFVETIFIPTYESLPTMKESELKGVIPLLDYSGLSLDEIHKESIRRTFESMRISNEVTKEPMRKLEICYKALFMFVRAYQDAMLKMLLAIEGQAPGNNSSMTQAVDWKTGKFKENNIIGHLLSDELPDYATWFSYWREKRNKVKEGIGYGISGDIKDIGISFNTVTRQGGIVVNNESVKIIDVISAIEMSSRLAQVGLKRIIEKAK
ncbi:hypothetical protein ACFLXU_03050 [Chloroflexota bacterium]